MLLVELSSRTREWQQKFSIVNINIVEGTKHNIKVMVVNIDKIQLTKLEVEDHWSQAHEKWQVQQLEYFESIRWKTQSHIEVYGTRYFWAYLCYGDGLCKKQTNNKLLQILTRHINPIIFF
jgi:hypothetical protein